MEAGGENEVPGTERAHSLQCLQDLFAMDHIVGFYAEAGAVQMGAVCKA